jgi:hypothetical protein
MKKYLLSKIVVILIITLFVGVNSASCANISNNISSDEEIIEDYTNENDQRIHAYFMVDFKITVRDYIFCIYLPFDIQGQEFIPFLNAFKLSPPWNNPAVDITITKTLGQTLDFTLEDSVYILALRLTDVDSNLPKFGFPRDGYFEGHALFIVFLG